MFEQSEKSPCMMSLSSKRCCLRNSSKIHCCFHLHMRLVLIGNLDYAVHAIGSSSLYGSLVDALAELEHGHCMLLCGEFEQLLLAYMYIEGCGLHNTCKY